MLVSLVGTLSSSRYTPKFPLPAISTAEQVSPAAPISCIEITAPLSISSKQASNRHFSIKGSPI